MQAVHVRAGRVVVRAAGDALQDARRQVRADLRADPALAYILLFSALLSAFWIWHRLPNFATRDERWRVVDPVEALAALSDDPSYGGLREGVTYWRTYGATFYVYGLVLVPVLVVTVVLGELEGFAAMGRHQSVSYWAHWLGTPGWVWTASVLAGRLAVVGFAVGSVYAVYRIGTRLRDRATGRLAAVLFSVTWGFLVLSHEVGEDVPVLFCFLVAFYLTLAYLESGSTQQFYRACFVGGAGAALKLNAGVVAVATGAAFVLRARRAPDPTVEELARPRFLAAGVALGMVVIIAGYPSVLVGDPAELGGRLKRVVNTKRSPHGWRVKPSWWWILRGYLHGFGVPLTAAAAGAVAASVPLVRERSRTADGVRLALLLVSVLLVVYAGWSYVRAHHLLLTFPLLVVVVAIQGTALHDRRPAVARVLLAALLVSSGVYAVGGDLAYASQPRDQAAAWIDDRAGANTTLETYVRDPQEAGVPHGVETRFVNNPARMDELPERCPDYVVLNYHGSLQFVAPASWSDRAETFSNQDAARYVRDLLNEDTYPYRVAARVGRRPAFLDGTDRRSTWGELLRAGLRPRTIQYGDPQDFGINQYTVILERTGGCVPAD